MSMVKRALDRQQKGKSLKEFDAWFAMVRSWQPLSEDNSDGIAPAPPKEDKDEAKESQQQLF
jgi:hypothetical protein